MSDRDRHGRAAPAALALAPAALLLLPGLRRPAPAPATEEQGESAERHVRIPAGAE